MVYIMYLGEYWLTGQKVPCLGFSRRQACVGRRMRCFTVAAIEDGMPLLVQAREIIAAFHTVIHQTSGVDLDAWLERARASTVASFAGHQGQGRDLRRNCSALVQWPNRGPDHQAQTSNATCTGGENRSASSQATRRRLFIES